MSMSKVTESFDGLPSYGKFCNPVFVAVGISFFLREGGQLFIS